MKSPQDKICDALTLIGLLCVIAFGSWSLLPETEARMVQPAQEETPLDEPLPADTIEEVNTPYETTRPVEESVDSLIGDTLAIEDTFETDSLATPHGSEHENTHPEHHEDASATPENATHEKSSEENASHKKSEDEHTHSESLME